MLEVKDLHYLYNTKAIDGLHGINISLRNTQILGLMGPSGCGKSTLASLIAGKLTPKSGDINILSKHVLYLEEELLNSNKTLLENFVAHAYGDTDEQKITKARMACSDLEITNYINTPINQLSTGQFQRALLGVSLVAQADLIILDEPFSHLETPLKKELVEIILPLIKDKGISLLWISHDQKLLMSYCDQIAIMNYGKIQQIDSPETLYFKPSNLFTADFLGYSNKEFLSNGKSLVWDIDFSINDAIMNDPLLIYRPEAISIASGDNTINATLVDSVFDGTGYVHTFQYIDTTIISRTHMPLSANEYKLSLNVDFVNILSEV